MKKLISLVLISLFLMSITMTGCIAEDAWKNNIGTIDLDTMTVTGNGISVSGNTINITSGGDFTVTGTLADGMIYAKTDSKVKLRLSGANITNLSGPAIFFDNVEEGLITITEYTENYLTDGGSYNHQEADAVIFSNDDIEIKGSGTLIISANYKHAIAGDDDVKIENGNISITAVEHGIKVNDTLAYSNATINIASSTGKGMKAEKELIIDSGIININSFDEGIECKGPLTINGGEINIISAEDGINTGSSNSSTTQEFTPPTMPDMNTNGENKDMSSRDQMPKRERPQGNMGRGQGNMEGRVPPDIGGKMPEGMTPPDIGGKMPEGMTPPDMGGKMPEGMTPPNMGGTGRIDEETAAAHAITINGGNIHINAKGDGIDSNGNLTINGGRIVVDGPTNAGNGPLDSDGVMTVKGGEIITTSVAGMMQMPSSSSANMLRVSFDKTQESKTFVSIKDVESGEVILSQTPENKYQVLVFISNAIVSGKKYEIYLGSDLYQSFTANEGTTIVGNSGFGGGRGGFGGGFGGGRGDRNFGPRGENNPQDITVSLNGANINFATKPVTRNNTTLVGFRAILEALGATVGWDSETQTVTATKDNTKITLQIGSFTAYVNGKTYELLAAPEIVGESTMVPVRFMSEQLGMKVAWDEATKKVSINS